jgi:hypothetical protein
VPGGAALTRNDVTGDHALAAERLDAKALALESRPFRDEPPAFCEPWLVSNCRDC